MQQALDSPMQIGTAHRHISRNVVNRKILFGYIAVYNVRQPIQEQLIRFVQAVRIPDILDAVSDLADNMTIGMCE